MPNNHDGQAVDAVKFVKQLDRSGELEFEGLLGLLTVHTQNSIYQFDLGNGVVRGGVLGNDWVKGAPSGTTFGGSMIMIGRLLKDAYMEFVADGRVFTSSRVKDISYRKPEDM